MTAIARATTPAPPPNASLSAEATVDVVVVVCSGAPIPPTFVGLVESPDGAAPTTVLIRLFTVSTSVPTGPVASPTTVRRAPEAL